MLTRATAGLFFLGALAFAAPSCTLLLGPEEVTTSSGAGGDGSGGNGGDGAECMTANDCLLPTSECVAVTCVTGKCVRKRLGPEDHCVFNTANFCDYVGECVPCPYDTSCESSADCPKEACFAPTCHDGLKSPGETDVDCGGECIPCPVGLVCNFDTDCQSNHCNNGVACLPPSCDDEIWNPGESGIDCGGPYCEAKCPLGALCSAFGECESGVCANGFCDAPSACKNGKKDADESDVDCGGAECFVCAAGKSCNAGSDCESALCAGSPKACQAAACSDGERNGGESDTDCGGGCAPCGDGKSCLRNDDCASGKCQFGEIPHTCVP